MANFAVASLNDYLEKIEKIQNSLETFIYRGQSDESWRVVSGVYRRIEESKRQAKFPKAIVEHEEIRAYLKEKLAEARKRLTPAQIAEIQEPNDINILVEMQHYGAATNLIDFSFNSLIALYFACVDNQDRNGKVFCISNSNTFKVLATNEKSLDKLLHTPDGKFYSYSPNHSNRRIIKQDSIFLFNDVGYIDESLIDHSFTIQSAAKGKIIQELKDSTGITEESIYPDFLGYLQANNARKPFKIRNAQDYFEQAVRLHKQRDYEQAIQYYEKSLALDPGQSKALLGITQCLRLLTKYKEALATCNEAKKLDNKNFLIYNEAAIINTYLKDYTEARSSFKSAEALIGKGNSNQRRIFDNNRGWMYLCFGEVEQAKAILVKLVDDEKPYHEAINLAHCYLLEKNEEEALKFYVLCRKNATSDDIFKNSLDSDYVALQMEQWGITKEYFEELKGKMGL